MSGHRTQQRGDSNTVTLAIAARWPDRFGRLLVMSPAVWWDQRAILRHLRRDPLEPTPRVYLDIGRREGARAVADARALRSVLAQQTSALRFVEDPDGRHTELDWARRLPDAMAWLLGVSPPDISASGRTPDS